LVPHGKLCRQPGDAHVLGDGIMRNQQILPRLTAVLGSVLGRVLGVNADSTAVRQRENFPHPQIHPPFACPDVANPFQHGMTD